MSTKRLLATVVVLLVFGSIVLLGYRIYQTAMAKQAVAERVRTLPDFELRSLRGNPVRRRDLSSQKPVVLVFFRTTCPFCESEAQSIRQNEALHRAAQTLMISHEREAELKAFVDKHGLGQEGIHVLRDSEGKMADAFGVSTVPNTFVYGADRRLVQHFKGEASSEAIYRALVGEAADTPSLEQRGEDSCPEDATQTVHSTECALVP